MSVGPRSLSLGEDLRDETRALHAEVERSTFIATLLRGELSRAAYSALLRNFHAIYEAMEAAVDAHIDDPLIREVFVPQLRRVAKLQADLDFLHGPDWHTEIAVQPRTKIYVDRLDTLRSTVDAPTSVLIAHVYVRYLGDLSGGQILQSIVAARIAASNERGTAFYDFGDRESAERLASDMRVAFNSMNLPPPQTRAIVQEAIWGFEAHRELFGELAHEYLDPT